MTIFDLAVLVLGLGTGLTFAGHGAQKAFGWWNGAGMLGWQGAVAAMGFRPVGLFTAVSILNELVAGLCLAVGLFTPVAAAVLLAQSIVIIFHVHWQHGFWDTNHGIEFPLQLALACVALGLLGRGAFGLDAVLGIAPVASIRVALLLIGLIGGAVVLALPRLSPSHRPAAQSR